MRTASLAPALALALAANLLSLAGPARAQSPGAGDAAVLAEAQSALSAGEYERAARLGASLATSPRRIARGDRAEAWRLRGLALFFLERHEGAEAALLEFLKLDPDANLDPTLVPPEAIVFFEDVRVRHAAELRRYRERPKVPRYLWLNLVPAGGQFQNGEPVKGWIVAGASTALLASSVTTYLMLRENCGRHSAGHYCKDPGASDVQIAVNVASTLGFAAVYAYSVVDGFIGYRRLKREAAAWEQESPMSVGVSPSNGGAFLSLSGRF